MLMGGNTAALKPFYDMLAVEEGVETLPALELPAGLQDEAYREEGQLVILVNF